jgi:hypothetical protein
MLSMVSLATIPSASKIANANWNRYLDHLIIMNESHLRAILQGYICYYNTQRTHLGINKDSPEPRQVHTDGRKTYLLAGTNAALQMEFARSSLLLTRATSPTYLFIAQSIAVNS